jgi:hypothetical protein
VKWVNAWLVIKIASGFKSSIYHVRLQSEQTELAMTYTEPDSSSDSGGFGTVQYMTVESENK